MILGMGSVAVCKITETDLTMVHRVGIVRTDRVGLFPGFCPDSFPFAISQLGDFNGDEYLAQENIKYLGWTSHHLGMK